MLKRIALVVLLALGTVALASSSGCEEACHGDCDDVHDDAGLSTGG